MLCKIVTAVSVFIGSLFWLHFFSNCGSYEQEGNPAWPGCRGAQKWGGGGSGELGRVGAGERVGPARKREGEGGSSREEVLNCVQLRGDTHQSLSF